MQVEDERRQADQNKEQVQYIAVLCALHFAGLEREVDQLLVL